MNSPHYVAPARRQPPASELLEVVSWRIRLNLFAMPWPPHRWPPRRAVALMLLGVSLVACLCLGGCQPNESLMPDTRLLELADDPNCPIVFDQEAGEFQLVIQTYIDGETVERRIPLRFSPRTGETLPSQRSPRMRPPSPAEMSRLTEQLKTVRTLSDVQAVMGQSESLLIELARDPQSPVKYDDSVAEFHLEYNIVDEYGHVTRANIWRYSPFTGRALPSRRAELFMEWAPEDVAMVEATLLGAQTMAEVEAAWGPPDQTVTGAHHFYTPGRMAQHRYTNVTATLEILVWENEDGTIDFTYGGKRKPK
jgi:hypothetical protein